MSYITYDSGRSSWDRLDDWLDPRDERGIRVYGSTRRIISHTPLNLDTDDPVANDAELDVIVVREDNSAKHDESLERAWLRVGYTITFGLVMFLLGILFRFIYPGPVPLAVAAIGMTLIAMALWRGGKIEQVS
jgi:hypothetical protein